MVFDKLCCYGNRATRVLILVHFVKLQTTNHFYTKYDKRTLLKTL